ncbi:ring finger ubiquitin ligase [Drepanopeziza brunnea f. sp. 'multigermtubi' MB_m1]|uniref:DSC E3 ubiquitin ligase complex subunit A n=1 Tax=Marssonina brunnea f. sp. multigermtubi (strain MB_m1) TaxID=1072389 RepID=K1XGI3_MARBU|nr:ring finger ubiquitin ligase [Drepanopeziza brunnea f. sp. 'multigermtubi' MB_m1]EKD19923.1 ring finger ubiquitin ligase [Drepanopeziza brunnea f. sp. 'multigermtubi' MB_m1]
MPTQQPPPQEYARVILIIILLFFLYTSPDQGPPPGFQSPRDYATHRIDRFRHDLDILNTTKWGDFAPKTAPGSKNEAAKYLNLTGFREEDDYAWERLDAFKKRSLEFTEEAKLGSSWKDPSSGEIGDVYQNATGVVRGRWTRHTADLNGQPRERVMNLTEISPVTNWAFRDEEYWLRNITGTEGKLMMRLEERGEDMDVTEDTPDDLSLPVKPANIVREVAATVTIQDESSSGDGWDMKVHGAHWPKQGVMLLTTTSEKFAGVFGLPHLTLDSNQFLASQRLFNKTLGAKVGSLLEKTSWNDLGNPWTSSPDSAGDSTMPTPHCEYVVYIQLYPMNVYQGAGGPYFDQSTIVDRIEEELRFPNGAPIPPAPGLKMSTVIFSPDCGFILESKGPPKFAAVDGTHLNGKKQEIYLFDVKQGLHALTATMFGQILLLKMQSKEASTPSTVGRVSLFTIAMMLMADAMLFSSLSLLTVTAPNIFPAALLTAFVALMSLGIGIRFVSAVYTVQEPERRERLRAQQAAEAANAPTRTATALGSAPLPNPIITAAGPDVPLVTPAVTPTPTRIEAPIIIPSDQDIDAEIEENLSAAASASLLPTANSPATTQTPPRTTSSFGVVYMKFVLTSTFLLFLTVSSVSWSVPIRTAFINLLSFTYLSFWVPQIRRNAVRSCRKALLWKFIIGQSVLRLLPFAYFYLREDNIMFAETDWKAFCVLVGWVWIQIWVLVGQEVLGPRWGLPHGWYEPGWDYHPILSEDNVESGGLPIGLVQIPGSPSLERVATGESGDMESRKKQDDTVRIVDCAICMQILEVPVVAAGEDVTGSGAAGGVGGMLARRQYMVTPCRHIFHTACLEGWMRFRLQCPNCRENLPAL